MRIIFTGDLVIKNKKNNRPLLSKRLQEIFEQQDIVCGNLEGPVVKDDMQPIFKKGASIKQEKNAIMRLEESGFNLFSLANNHIMDYGIAGLRNTLSEMDYKTRYIGAGEGNSCYDILKIVDNNATYGFLAVAEGGFGVSKWENSGYAWMLSNQIYDILKKAKEECDFFFVICHCGAEELKIPLPEVRSLYHFFVDMGASAVIGHHPHVIQGYEKYNNSVIYYSLGNFIFDMDDGDVCHPYNPIGMCVQIDVRDKIYDKPFLVKYDEFQVDLFQDKWILEEAIELLENELKYKKLIKSWCISAFENIYKTYYAAVVGLDIMDEVNMKKFGKHRLNGDEIKWDEHFLYHNISIETHRWVCERALTYLCDIY